MVFKISRRNRKARARNRRGQKADKNKTPGTAEGGRLFKWRAISLGRRDPRRYFTWWEKKTVWDRQGGKCARSNEALDWKTVEFDHVIPWSAGGRTTVDNCEALTPEEHLKKSRKEKIKHAWT